MKEIRSNIPKEELVSEFLLVENNESHYALIESGFPTVENCINIVFGNKNEIPYLLNKAHYYESKSHLFGKSNDELNMIQVKDVIYIEAVNNDTYIYTKENSYLVKDKLYELEKTLYEKKFVRISKSFIVSINHIEKIKPTFNGKLMLKLDNKQSLEVTRHYLSAFRTYLGL